jgi:hypothetical protein
VKSEPLSMQFKGKVSSGWVGVPMEVCECLVGPQSSSKAEKVAPVSGRKEIVLPSMMAVTLGSPGVIIIGQGSPGSLQSLAASPRRLVREGEWWRGLDPPP